MLTDGVGGIWHDPTVDRVSTSTGSVDNLFSSTAFTKLVIDSSTWFGGGVKDTHPILLDQVLDEFGGKRLLLAHPKDTAAARLVIDEVTQRGLTEAVQVQTFSRSDPELALAAGMNGQLLIQDTAQAGVDTPAALVAEHGVTRACPCTTPPRDSVIRSYVAAGLTVSVWNVTGSTAATSCTPWAYADRQQRPDVRERRRGELPPHQRPVQQADLLVRAIPASPRRRTR